MGTTGKVLEWGFQKFPCWPKMRLGSPEKCPKWSQLAVAHTLQLRHILAVDWYRHDRLLVGSLHVRCVQSPGGQSPLNRQWTVGEEKKKRRRERERERWLPWGEKRREWKNWAELTTWQILRGWGKKKKKGKNKIFGDFWIRIRLDMCQPTIGPFQI